MRTTKQVTIYTGLLIMVSITVFGIYSGSISALIAPALGVVLAIMNAKHIFDDPDFITELKAEHADAIRTLTHGHTDYVAKKDAEHREAITKLDAEIAALKLKLSEEHERLIEAWKKIPSANSRTIGQVMMAPGSATTQSRSR